MGKRKHGTASVPFTFSTRNYEILRAKRTGGENVSAYIDRAIEYYDTKINWQLRGRDRTEVELQEFRRALSFVRKHVEAELPDANPNVVWINWLKAKLADARRWGDEEE